MSSIATPQLFGFVPDPRARDVFVSSLPDGGTLASMAPMLVASASDYETTLLYRALLKVWPRWIVGKQGIGDCVSWGWMHALLLLLARMVVEGLISEDQMIAIATEAIYGGSRVEARGRTEGGWSDGSTGSWAAKFVSKWGILLRKPYGSHDLTTYSSQRAKQWGNYGVPDELEAIAREKPVKRVALVRTVAEAKAAICGAGTSIPVCSMQGFSNRRDQDGFARPEGTWAHCMCLIGWRGGRRPGFLCLNSWGPNWITGPKWPEDQPDGSFWIDEATVAKMLSSFGGDSYAVSNVEGFEPAKLDWAKAATAWN